MSRLNPLAAANLDDNDGRLIRIVRDAKLATRAELIEATGWARSTISRRVDALVNLGLLATPGEAKSSGGRPPSLLRFNGDAGSILAADLGISHSRLAAVNLLGRPIGEATDIEIDLSRGPAETLPQIIQGLRDQAAQCEQTPLAAVVGLPAPIDAESGRPAHPPILSTWHDHPVGEELRREFDLPTFIEKDVNLMALGEQRNIWPHARSLVFVKVGTGIGSGIVLDGELHRGATGAAGDVGHIQLEQHRSTLCRCGRHGCLEAIAGGAALATRMRALGRNAHKTRDVAALLHAGDPEAKALVREAGELIGQVLSSIVSFANPQVIVFGGDLGGEPLLLGAARAEILRRPLELGTRDLQFVASNQSAESGILGAAALAIDRLWPPHSPRVIRHDSSRNPTRSSHVHLGPSMD